MTFGLSARAGALACAAGLLVSSGAVHGARTVTLGTRTVAGASPVAALQPAFVEARRVVAETTPQWSNEDIDLAAWGPVLVFALLDRAVENDVVVKLAAPLEETAPAGALLFRTLGLYAAKGRVPFVPTPALLAAIRRNLSVLGAVRESAELAALGPLVPGWGAFGIRAWVTYLELLYRDYGELADPDAARWNATGIAGARAILAAQRSARGGFPGDDAAAGEQLWPNVLAIYALMKAYENEEDVGYETGALAAAAAVEALRQGDGSYRLNTVETVSDPRGNAFLAGALLQLFKNTGEPMYRDRAAEILRWLSRPAAFAALSAATKAQVGWLILLADSLSTQRFENIFGRRPMRIGGAPAGSHLAEKLRPPDFPFREMFDGILGTLVEHAPFADGAFAYDYGDSPGYAAEVLLAAGSTSVPAAIVERQQRLLSGIHLHDLDEMAFGAAALQVAMERASDFDAAAAERALRRYLAVSAAVASLEDGYCERIDRLTGGGGYDYGPTVIGAQMAGTQMEYAASRPGRLVFGFFEPLSVGRRLLAGADRVAWDAAQRVYRARAGQDVVWVLPNAMMIVELVRAHRLTGDPAFLVRARETAQGLEALWDPVRGAFFSNSGEVGVAGYESLSTNSYAAQAFLHLAQATQDVEYRRRAATVLDFIRRDLYADGVAYHHVYRGRRAAGDIWCVGCNWRVLSILAASTGSTGR